MSCLLMANVAWAQAEPAERLNGIGFGAIYKFHAFRESASATGEELPGTEHLGGFVIGYERILIAGHLSLSIAKPFLFSRDRLDSPLDITLRGLFRKQAWEPFVGVGVSNNVRFFPGEREEAEGKGVEYTLGIVFIAGFSYYFTPKWALQVEVAYIWNVFIKDKDGFEHELATVLDGVFYF
jgi:hypothetical protein